MANEWVRNYRHSHYATLTIFYLHLMFSRLIDFPFYDHLQNWAQDHCDRGHPAKRVFSLLKGNAWWGPAFSRPNLVNTLKRSRPSKCSYIKCPASISLDMTSKLSMADCIIKYISNNIYIYKQISRGHSLIYYFQITRCPQYMWSEITFRFGTVG